MNARSFLLFALFALTASSLFSQREETVIGRRGFGLSGIWGGSNHQITRFGNTNSYMNGGFFGLEFGKCLFIGFTRLELEEDIKWDQLTAQPFKMRYRGLKLDYSFNSHKAIHPVINLDLAPGRVELVADNLRDRIFVVQPGAGVEINVLRWFHLGLQGGYRFVTDTNLPTLNDKDLSGAYGQVSLKFGWSWGRPNRWESNKRRDRNSDIGRDDD